MFNDWHYMVTQDRMAREQDLADRVAERSKQQKPPTPSLSAPD